MGWPLALVLATVVFGLFIIIVTVVSGNASVAAEKAKEGGGERYRQLAADYETLARETRDATGAIKSDLSELRLKIESIEKMMREVG
jgi:5-bromo-4-chloroindolyl phosphate hydrolysis protein